MKFICGKCPQTPQPAAWLGTIPVYVDPAWSLEMPQFQGFSDDYTLALSCCKSCTPEKFK